MMNSTYNLPEFNAGFIGTMLSADLGLSILYSMVPVTFTPVRGLIDLVQLGVMALTMLIACRWMFDSF